MDKLNIVAVLAHPDDESFGMGGTLALYSGLGHKVSLICATRGEAGTVDEHFMDGFSSIAELRESELRCAAAHLGLHELVLLDHRDSGMPGSADNAHPQAHINQPVESVAAEVVGHIRRLKADVVLTFDPIGGYRHPDHIHIHNATNIAFEKCSDLTFGPTEHGGHQPSYLYYHTIPRGFMRFGVRLIRLFGGDPSRWGRNKDIDLESLANVSFPTHLQIDYSKVGDKKTAASACHASQGGAQMRKGFLGFVFRFFGEKDTYMQAYPPVSDDAPIRYGF